MMKNQSSCLVFSMSEAFEVQDNQPLNLSETRMLKLLYRVKKTSTKNLIQYSQYSQDTSWRDVVDKTHESRFRVFNREGFVKRVSRKRIPGATANDGIRSCFISYCQSKSGEPFHVVTLSLPNLWPLDEPLSEPVQFEGFLFGLVDVLEDGTEPCPLFLAKRLAWFPVDANEDLGVSRSLVALAKVGVDIGQFEFVRKQNTQALGMADSDCFYQVLANVGELPKDEQPFDGGFLRFISLPGLTDLSSVNYFGDRVVFEARVRSCTPVHVSDPALRIELGLETYYQLIVFPDLQGQQIAVDPAEKNLVYSQFPVTVCARALPAGYSPEQLIGELVSCESVYFRFWKYKSKLTDEAKVNGQLSPLFVVDQPAGHRPAKGLFEYCFGIFFDGDIVGATGDGLDFSKNENRQADARANRFVRC